MATFNELVSRWLSGMTNGAAHVTPVAGYAGPRGATSPASNTIAISASSQQSGALTGTLVHFWTTTLCYIAIGTNPTAVIATSYAVPANTVIALPINDQDKIAVIGTTGNAYFHPVEGDV